MLHDSSFFSPSQIRVEIALYVAFKWIAVVHCMNEHWAFNASFRYCHKIDDIRDLYVTCIQSISNCLHSHFVCHLFSAIVFIFRFIAFRSAKIEYLNEFRNRHRCTKSPQLLYFSLHLSLPFSFSLSVCLSVSGFTFLFAPCMDISSTTSIYFPHIIKQKNEIIKFLIWNDLMS